MIAYNGHGLGIGHYGCLKVQYQGHTTCKKPLNYLLIDF